MPHDSLSFHDAAILLFFEKSKAIEKEFMTGREKIEAAFSHEGASEIPAVICYERLYIRDHLDEFSFPWHYWYSPDIEELLCYRSETIESIRQDWFHVWPIETKGQRATTKIEKLLMVFSK